MSLSPLPELDGYRIASELGRGSLGVVFRGVRLADGRPVAIKLAHPQKSGELRERIRREFGLLRGITHPLLAELLDLVELPDGALALVYSCLEGEPLEARLGPRLPRRVELARWVADLCEGLGALHAAGVVHRDLKPANLMVGPDGRLRLLDFGLSRPDRPGATLTDSGVVVGTPTYLAPENLRGERIGPSGDLYAAACVVHELVSGRPPFDGEPAEILRAHLDRPPPPLEVPGSLRDVLKRALAKRPESRPRDAGELGAQLALAFQEFGDEDLVRVRRSRGGAGGGEDPARRSGTGRSGTDAVGSGRRGWSRALAVGGVGLALMVVLGVGAPGFRGAGPGTPVGPVAAWSGDRAVREIAERAERDVAIRELLGLGGGVRIPEALAAREAAEDRLLGYEEELRDRLREAGPGQLGDEAVSAITGLGRLVALVSRTAIPGSERSARLEPLAGLLGELAAGGVRIGSHQGVMRRVPPETIPEASGYPSAFAVQGQRWERLYHEAVASTSGRPGEGEEAAPGAFRLRVLDPVGRPWPADTALLGEAGAMLRGLEDQLRSGLLEEMPVLGRIRLEPRRIPDLVVCLVVWDWHPATLVDLEFSGPGIELRTVARVPSPSESGAREGKGARWLTGLLVRVPSARVPIGVRELRIRAVGVAALSEPSATVTVLDVLQLTEGEFPGP